MVLEKNPENKIKRTEQGTGSKSSEIGKSGKLEQFRKEDIRYIQDCHYRITVKISVD